MQKFFAAFFVWCQLGGIAVAAPQDITRQLTREYNVLANPGFENGLSRWTKSGGVLALLTSGANFSGVGLASASWAPSATGQTLTTSQTTIPAALYNKSCLASVYYKGGDSNLTLQAIDGSSTVLGSLALTAATNWGEVQISFPCPGSSTMALRVNNTGGSAAATIYLDQAFLGIAQTTMGAAIGDWQTFTPTGSWTTNTTYTGAWRRIGDSMQVAVKLSLAGAPNAANLTVNLPTGYTINTTTMLFNGATAGHRVYTGSVTGQSGGSIFSGAIVYDTTTDVSIYSMKTYAGTNPQPVQPYLILSQTQPQTFASGDFVLIDYMVPIVGWTSNVYLQNLNNSEFAYNTAALTTAGGSDTTSFASGPAGALLGAVNSATVSANSVTSMRVRFANPIKTSDYIVLELQEGAGSAWHPAIERYPALRANGAVYGVQLNPVSGSTTDLDVQFGNGGAASTSTFGAAGLAWPNVATTSWRVRKTSTPAISGFNMFNPGTALGLVGINGLTGFTDGSSGAAGTIGESIRSVVSFAGRVGASFVAGQYGNVTSMTLTAGDWDVSALMSLSAGSVPSSSSFSGAISTFSGNTITDQNDGDNQVTTNSAVTQILTIPAYRMSLSTSTVVYMKMQVNAGATMGSNFVWGRLSARRAR